MTGYSTDRMPVAFSGRNQRGIRPPTHPDAVHDLPVAQRAVRRNILRCREMTDDGHLIRLFPVPFLLVEDDQQFKKRQWISARVRRVQEDAQPESHRVSLDTIKATVEPLHKRLFLRPTSVPAAFI